jgi:hypothetical protein
MDVAQRLRRALAVAHTGELDRLDRAVLTDRFQKILEFADQLERQLSRVTGLVKEGSR